MTHRATRRNPFSTRETRREFASAQDACAQIERWQSTGRPTDSLTLEAWERGRWVQVWRTQPANIEVSP